MSDLFNVHGKVDFTPFPFLLCFVLFSSHPGCPKCSNVIIMARIIYISIKPRVFSLRTPDPRRLLLQVVQTQAPPVQALWGPHDFTAGIVLWEVSKDSVPSGLHPVRQAKGPSLAWEAVVWIIVLVPKRLAASQPPACFSFSGWENATSSFLHPHPHVGDEWPLERHILMHTVSIIDFGVPNPLMNHKWCFLRRVPL